MALVGDGEVVGGGTEAARLVDDGADEERGETETEENIIAEDTEDDSEVVVEDDTELVVVEDNAELVVVEDDTELVVETEDDVKAVDWGGAPATIVHCRTTFTRGSPPGPVIGVNVIVHV